MTVEQKKQLIEAAVLFLAGRCDGAISDDGEGFNGTDTRAGHVWANEIEATGEIRSSHYHDVHSRIWKYRKTQLEPNGLPLPDSFDKDEGMRARIFIFNGGTIGIRFPFNRDLIALVKSTKARWNPGEKVWSWDPSRARKALKSLSSAGVDLEYQEGIWDYIEEKERESVPKLLLVGPNDIAFQAAYDPVLVDISKSVRPNKWDQEKRLRYYPIRVAAEVIAAFGDKLQWIDPRIPEAIKKLQETPAPAAPRIQYPAVILDGDQILVRFNYSRELVALIKSLPLRQWDPKEKVWKVPTNQVLLLLERLGDHLKYIDPEIQKLAARFREPDAEVMEYGGLELYPFQAVGVRFLEERKKAAIFDQMGLGKSVQTIAAIERNNAYPALMVVKASLKGNWANEYRKWLDQDTVILESRTPYNIPEGTRVVIINYDILKFWREKLEAFGFKAMVADEATELKNSRSQRSKAFRELSEKIEHLYILTGTPIFDSPIDAWHLLHLIDPKGFPSYFKFAVRYCGAVQGRWGLELGPPTNVEELKKVSSHLYLRRLKKDVLKDLPEKRRIDVEFDLLPTELRELARLWKLRQSQVKMGMKHLIGVFSEIRRMTGRLKIRAIKEWVEDFLVASDDPLILMAHHKEVVDELSNALECPKLDGSTHSSTRTRLVDDFQAGKIRVLVVSLTAGGMGLTLTRAHDMVICEPHWTPGLIEQAEDRIHRIGQSERSTIYNLWGNNTFDDFMRKILRNKESSIAVIEREEEVMRSKAAEIIRFMDHLVEEMS